jgi:hypothetical protein
VKAVPNKRPGGEGQFVKRTHVVFDDDDDNDDESDSEYQEMVINFPPLS